MLNLLIVHKRLITELPYEALEQTIIIQINKPLISYLNSILFFSTSKGEIMSSTLLSISNLSLEMEQSILFIY